FPAPASPAASPGRYRPGLDGLRALAVTAVLLYHADIHWMRGGFLGVDLFFVLSGFLITSLLIVELEGSGRIGFASFYRRRARGRPHRRGGVHGLDGPDRRARTPALRSRRLPGVLRDRHACDGGAARRRRRGPGGGGGAERLGPAAGPAPPPGPRGRRGRGPA